MPDLKTGIEDFSAISLSDSVVLINDVNYDPQPQDVESHNKNGGFYGGKVIKTKMVVTIKGEVLEDGKAALQALVNTGGATAASWRVTDLDLGEPNEGKHDFTLTCHYYENTASSYKIADE